MTKPVTSELISSAGDAAAIIESTENLAVAALTPQELALDVVRVVTPRWGAEIIDLERYAETPRRKRGDVQLGTTESLARYLNVHRTAGTTLYADGDDLTVTAIINDHDRELAGHRDHRAKLTLERTPGCERWLKAHARFMDQESFAQLVEDGLTEIARPDGATLLEVVQTIHATNNATFRSGVRLQDGQIQLQYVENIAATAGPTGDMTIPETVTLVFEPFFGAQPIQVEARLRFRITNGALTLGVWLIRHVEEIRAAFEAEIASLKDLTADGEQDGLLALAGSPE